MYKSTFSKIIIAAGAFTLLSVAALWSFNALSELFGGPQAQYQHVIAAIVLLLVLKWGLTRHRGGDAKTRINHRHCRGSDGKACEQ
jgi:membrane protein implicated in regulation of membrane protease activity